jgi:hypothetical protein
MQRGWKKGGCCVLQLTRSAGLLFVDRLLQFGCKTLQ